MSLPELIEFVRIWGSFPFDTWAASALLSLLFSAGLLLLTRRIPLRVRPRLSWLPLLVTGLSFALWISLLHQAEGELLGQVLTYDRVSGAPLRLMRIAAQVTALLHPGGWVYLLVWPLTVAASLRLAGGGARVWSERAFGATAAALLAAPAMTGAGLGARLLAQIGHAGGLRDPDLGSLGALAHEAQGARPFVLGIALLGGGLAVALSLREAARGESRAALLRSRAALLAACLLLVGGIAAFRASRPYAADAPHPLRLVHPFWGDLPEHDYPLPRPAAWSCRDWGELDLFFDYEGGRLHNAYDQPLSPEDFAEVLEALLRHRIDLGTLDSPSDYRMLLLANPRLPLGPLLPYLREMRRQGVKELYWTGIRLEPVERRTLPGRVHALRCIARTRIEWVLAEPEGRTVGELLERPEAPPPRRPINPRRPISPRRPAPTRPP